MAGKTDYLENKILDHILKNTAYTSPTTVYIALFTAAPSDAYTSGSPDGTEVSGNAYARQSVAFASASSGATSNSADITFPTPTGSWGTVTHFGIFDASTAGNLLYWNSLTASQAIASGNIVKFLTGDIDVSED